MDIKKKMTITKGTMEVRIVIHIPLELSRFMLISVLCSEANFCKSEIVISDGKIILVNFSTLEMFGVKNKIPVSSFDS